MDYLLDTHTLIWFLNGDRQLSKKAQSIIEDSGNRKFVSVCSLWEISIKLGLKKLEFDGTIPEIIDLLEHNDFEVLSLSISHIAEYEGLAFVHRDPFDRMLVVQAQVDDLTIITKDENIAKYPVKTAW
jgi:PIN domain nuclease of toxin-antitoxin system